MLVRAYTERMVRSWAAYGIQTIPKELVEEFKKPGATFGAGWGGEYDTNKDGMHLELLAPLTIPRTSRPVQTLTASAGPYGAALADGSEYRGRYGRGVRELAAWHRPRLEVLAEAGPDVLALETVPDIDEAEALMTAVAGLGIPAWLSYSIADGRTRAGQPLAAAFAVPAGVPEVVAVGVNCCTPTDVPAAIAIAREVTGMPVIVYPNSGEEWDARRRAWAEQSRYCPRHVTSDWRAPRMATSNAESGCPVFVLTSDGDQPS